MTMLSTTRLGAWWLRGGVLTAALAMLVPLATAASASSLTHGGFGGEIPYPFSPFESGYVNDVTAIAGLEGRDVFRAKFQLGTGDGFAVSATNRVDALTIDCTDCNALAIGFQVVFTTEQDLKTLREVNLMNAQTGQCDSECSAVALGYQVVVASDTTQEPDWLGFTQLLTGAQSTALSDIRAEVDGLPQAGLTLDQIQSECEDLVGEVVDILQDPNYPAPADASPTVTPTPTPTPTPVGSPPPFEQFTGGNGLPTIDVYRAAQENLWPGWNGELTSP
jgi:hypothetical protein